MCSIFPFEKNEVTMKIAQSGLTLCNTLQSPWNSPDQNTAVGSLSLLQQIFPTQESNQDLLHCRWILYQLSYQGRVNIPKSAAAAAAAKSLQSCPTLCDPIDGSPPGFPAPGILQARTLDWVAISFSNAWKWKLKVKSFSCVQLFTTPWTAAYQAPPSMGFSRQEYWSGVPSPSPFPNLAAVNRYFNAITLSETIIVTLTELYLFK